MKKTIKTLMTSAIAIALLFSATIAFAEESTNETTRQDYDKALTRLFYKYDSDNLDAYQAVKDEHKAFHESRTNDRSDIKEHTQSKIEEVKEALANEEITKDEAREAISEIRETVSTYREEAKSIIEAKKETNEQIKEQMLEVKEQIKNALAEDEVDESLIKSLLQQTLDLLNQHLELDKSTAQQIDELKAAYLAE
jgi:chromosome segregation ATPase